jgi:hypothetical protein
MGNWTSVRHALVEKRPAQSVTAAKEAPVVGKIEPDDAEWWEVAVSEFTRTYSQTGGPEADVDAC